MRGLVRTWWLPWVVSAVAITQTQLNWLMIHNWEGAPARLLAAPLLGASVLVFIAHLSLKLTVRLGWRDWSRPVRTVGDWAAGTLAAITGLGSQAGRRAWFAGLTAVLLGLCVLTWHVRVRPMIGSALVKDYVLSNLAPAGHGLETFFFDGLDHAKGPRGLGAHGLFAFKDAHSFPGGKKKNFELRKLGTIYAKREGYYGLGGVVDDGLIILVDGRPVVKAWKISAPRRVWGRIWLNTGWHAIEIRYFQGLGGATLKLSWHPPDGRLQDLSTARLRPLKPGTPLMPLTRTALAYGLEPEDRYIHNPFGEGRHWRLAWW